MKKRAIGALLWLYVGWYAGTLLSELMGIDMLVGLIPGAVAAIVLIGIPSRIRAISRPVPRKAVSSSI